MRRNHPDCGRLRELPRSRALRHFASAAGSGATSKTTECTERHRRPQCHSLATRRQVFGNKRRASGAARQAPRVRRRASASGITAPGARCPARSPVGLVHCQCHRVGPQRFPRRIIFGAFPFRKRGELAHVTTMRRQLSNGRAEQLRRSAVHRQARHSNGASHQNAAPREASGDVQVRESAGECACVWCEGLHQCEYALQEPLARRRAMNCFN